MFRNLKNEAKITFRLKTDSPLSIRSGSTNDIDPTLPDMQCIRTQKDGKATVFIPGSSLKGVIRSRYEKIVNLLEGKACNSVFRPQSCSGRVRPDKKTASQLYEEVCEGCKLFGSGVLGSRIGFKDAYPVDEELVIGIRNGVGINRITGAAQNRAIYNFEVVEEGTFEATISLTNFQLYQLKLLLLVLKDIDEGYVSLGASTTRGNGKLKVQDLDIEVRDYRKQTPTKLRGFNEHDLGAEAKYEEHLYYKKFKAKGLAEVTSLLDDVKIKF